jgi:SAM-dependent methyltransferase
MRTNYPGHDRSYQQKRNTQDYAGWSTEADWQRGWQPLIQKLAVPKSGTLLELGCGAGNVSIYLAQAGYLVTGVDIAPSAIDWARENAAQAQVNIDFILDDVLTLAGVADGGFDIVLDGHCFHCIIGGDRPRFLQTAHRLLKPNGILVIRTMCNDVPAIPGWGDRFDSQTRCLVYDGIATRYIGDSNEIVQEIIQADFRLLSVELVPPMHSEDMAELQVIAEKPSSRT